MEDGRLAWIMARMPPPPSSLVQRSTRQVPLSSSAPTALHILPLNKMKRTSSMQFYRPQLKHSVRGWAGHCWAIPDSYKTEKNKKSFIYAI
jgi:hypothetical protein